MIRRTSRVLYVGVLLMGVASLGGCATKKFVRNSVAPVASQVQTHETHLGTLDKQTQEAMARAEAAGKLAEGKFVYSLVLSDDTAKFPVNRHELSKEAKDALDAFAERLKTENKNVYLEIQGHTDSTGPENYNLKLGEERAEAVRRYLNKAGVALNRMSTISYGAAEPVESNKTKDGRSKNRRVVVIVLA